MSHSSKSLIPTVLATAWILWAASSAQAGHVYAGLTDTNGSGALNAGDALSFVSNTTGAVVTGPSMGVQSMSEVTVGSQAGLYITNNISYTALTSIGSVWNGTGASATGVYFADSAFGPMPGSFIELRIASVTGPTGAKFSLWDEGISTTAPATTFTIGTGVTAGSGSFNLTDPKTIIGNGSTALPANPNTGVPYAYPNYAPALNGLPSGFTWNDADGNGPSTVVSDSYGHVHGRTMTVDTPGTYTVSYILHDATGQQADSTPFVVTYSAVPEPTAVALLGGAGLLVGALRRRRSIG